MTSVQYKICRPSPSHFWAFGENFLVGSSRRSQIGTLPLSVEEDLLQSLPLLLLPLRACRLKSFGQYIYVHDLMREVYTEGLRIHLPSSQIDSLTNSLCSYCKPGR